MPLTSAIHESLPYIDAPISATQRNAALDLIALELGSQPNESHPSIPELLPSTLSSTMEAELQRASTGTKLSAIDTSRYEAQENPNQEVSTLQNNLRAAYTTQTYLSSRLTNLSLLEAYGKNAWLISNSQLEDILRSLEREVEEKKREIDELVIERKNAQENVAGEMRGYEDNWRRGVGRVLETEVAAEGVRREILERRRSGAV